MTHRRDPWRLNRIDRALLFGASFCFTTALAPVIRGGFVVGLPF